MTADERKAWDAKFDEVVDATAAKDAELTALRARVAVLEKVAEAARELEDARDNYAKKVWGAEYGEVWARYMNAFIQLCASGRRAEGGVMAVYYQPRDHFSDGYIRCPKCYGNGREIVKRESWEPPIYGDNTCACRECGGTGEVQECWPDDDALKEG